MTSKLLYVALVLSLGCSGHSEDHSTSPEGGSGGTAGASSGVGGGSGTSGGSSSGGGSGAGGSGGSPTSGGSGGETGGTRATGGSGATAGGGTAGGGTAGGAGTGSGGRSGTGGTSGHSGSANGGIAGEGGSAEAGASGAAGSASTACGGLAAKMCGTDEVCHWSNGSCGTGDQPGECILVGGTVCGATPVCGCDGKAYANACRAYGAGVDTTPDDSCALGNGAQGDTCLVDDDCSGTLKCCSLPIGLMKCTTPMGSMCPLTP